jgi:hypothetical protein
MADHMRTVIRAVHNLDLQTHAYQEDGDPMRIAAARNLASRLLLALEVEAKRLGIDVGRQEAIKLARTRK